MVIVIIGFTGQGKSTLAYYCAKRSPTRVIFDPRSQFFTGAETSSHCATLYDLLEEEAEVIIQPGRQSSVEDSFRWCSAELANWIEDNPREPIAYLVDEARLAGLDSKNISGDFDWIVRSAREGSPIDVIITCHRPTDVSTNIRAIANKIFLFRITLPNDLAVIGEQCTPEVAEAVAKLVDKTYIVWNNSRQQWRVITNSQLWHVALTKGPEVESTH
jgi:hypothetical protein